MQRLSHTKTVTNYSLSCLSHGITFLCVGAIALFIGLGAPILGAYAAETGWKGNEKSQLRLIASPAEWEGRSQLFAGIEIRLAPNWKTYWRTPGDTGIPPFFDWQGSQNLAKAEVLYPAPIRFKDPGGSSIGYKSRVVLPVRLLPHDPSKPVTLKLNANYAICHDLCVPVEAKQDLVIENGIDRHNASLIEMALSDVPQKRQSLIDDFGVAGVNLRSEAGKQQLDIIVKVPEDFSGLDLFIEAADGLYVPTPKRVETRSKSKADNKGVVHYAVDLGDVDDASEIKKAMLICTLKIDQRAIVQPCSLN